MNWMMDRLSNKGATWTVFASLLAGQLAWTQDFCEDFVDNPDPFDCDPVCFTEPFFFPWDCTPTPEGLDCFSTRGLYWGIVVADRVFAGDVVVRARLSPRFARPNPLAIAAHFDFESVSGYTGTLDDTVGIRLGRWDNYAANRVASFPSDFDLSDPALQLEFELRVVGDVVEFRVWDVNAKRPESPQVFFTNETTYRVGKAAVAFGAAFGPVRIYSFCVSELDDCNGNGVDDLDDIQNGTSQDANANDIPDECEPEPIVIFRRGDSNADGNVNIADGVSTLSFLLAGNQAPPCLDAADTDDSGELNVEDSIGTFNWSFLGGAAPDPPGYQQCGEDPTEDGLSCEVYTGVESPQLG